ncbi:putative methyltransferase DDB_G0268948 [Scyliorhinus torazame]
MAWRLFEEKKHAAMYRKYRLPSASEVHKSIFDYLEKKKGKPFTLAVDIGCGSGQSTRGLAPYFEKVVGIDVSEAQIEEAKKVDGPDNVSYRLGLAEELEFEDGSVDLVTAGTAAHWFDMEKFMKEAERILKPKGCVALYGYNYPSLLGYDNCPEDPAQIVEEMCAVLEPYETKGYKTVWTDYQELFDAITFPDKERAEDIYIKFKKPVSWIKGYLKSFGVYQIYLKNDPENAKASLDKVEQRLINALGGSSETIVELSLKYYCLLATKPE